MFFNEVWQIIVEIMNVNLDVCLLGDLDFNKGDGKMEGGGVDNSVEIFECLIVMIQVDVVKVVVLFKNDI